MTASLATERVDSAALRGALEALSVFGRPVGGTFADGVTRVAYSDEDVAARRFVMGLMARAGLDPIVDPAGNIVGRRPGTSPTLAPILFGSHIDSVPEGGNFDGTLGSLAAIEVARALDGQRIATRHPLEVVVWSNEEGVAFGRGLCGSRAAVGELPSAELDELWCERTKREAIRRIGGDPDRLAEARRLPRSVHAYLELHVEQSATLERAGIPIGILEGIVTVDRYEAVVRGAAGHAGTTSMRDRQDALLAAAQLILAVRDIVTRTPGRQVGTVGRLSVTPNAPNVVPGLASLTIDLRDLCAETIDRLAGEIRARAAAIALETGTTIEVSRAARQPGAIASRTIRTCIESACSILGAPYLALPCGAGHDAQIIAKAAPIGMIFVPSIGGLSHCPREATAWAHCALGADVLLQTVLAADRVNSLP
jgi:N-carbamoyl-L-amino-acid hydrolase